MEKKDRYVRALHQTIDDWSARLDRAEARVKALESGARELEQAREDTWEAARGEMGPGDQPPAA